MSLFLENRLISQKYFYCDNDNKDKIEIYKFKTISKININKEDKESLVKYLKEKKISIKYFEKFDGYINLVITEGYKENFDYFVKGIIFYFVNNLMKKKKILISIEDKLDIDMLIILFKNYFEDYFIVLKVEDIKNYFNYENYNKDLFFCRIEIDKNLIEIITYLEKYKNLLINIYDIILIENKKNYVYVETKNNLNLEKLNNYFLYNQGVYELYKLFIRKFLNFKGLIYLVEIEIIIENKKIRRFSIFFFDLIIADFFFFNLLDSLRTIFILDILKFVLIYKDLDLNSILLNKIINNINNINISFENEYVFTNYNNLIINKYNILEINDLNSLIFYLEYYNLHM